MHPALEALAATLREENDDDSVDVAAHRRLRGVFVVEGLAVSDEWTDVFEPVRRRPLWSRTWRQVKDPEAAAEDVRWFLRHRPDQAGE